MIDILSNNYYTLGSRVERERKPTRMLEALLNRIRPASERRALQNEAGVNELPPKELCKATWTSEKGERIIVNLLGTDKSQQIALLTKQNGKNGAVWIAKRDQSGKPGTWLWTEKQLEAGKRRDKRIRQRVENRPIQVAPIHQDRRTEILAIGKYLGISDDEIYERLKAEGFDTTLPQHYRTTWNPYEKGTTTEPLLPIVKRPPEKL